ncbi:hypothetical protein EMIHUDRAFT_227906 [Emiliania huxleyi CCMP1516]|uniref:SGNH hydrolase-type esterase domain-containing protein n=2 Tax=Emiliania huxleyi TaxID=2903 RepID=A0A0D3KH86_EMIH1|nr:hypothetical protein EMIHUDRAFT_227906 [Emiliania huxleyi CCMP1516]EOD35121.1 hypothetical protein EMIHUDRAFT_227906 [Emiliania huxleyi CCMP1516]|eukprot:XP_005787550.1 hypothetical protein EMIHUDRAFT_227906 [Emiliania huxleyi CCMP1516]
MADQTPCTASEARTDDAERSEAITPAAFYAAAAASALGFGGGRRTVATAVAANKLAWVPHDWSAARNGYENALAGPMQEDVCFHVNAELQAQGHGGPEGHFCVNAAVEMSLLYARGCGLYAQDEFLRDHLEEQDTLLVSVGGNDIALQPLLATLANACLRPERTCACPLDCPFDADHATCGTAACLRTGLAGWPLGLGYIVDLFRNKVERYVRRLVGKTRPRKVACTPYGWADPALCCLGYNWAPASNRTPPGGVAVVAFPLFEVLDGKTSSDYHSRVEPSSAGGRKMARALVKCAMAPLQPAPRQPPAPHLQPWVETPRSLKVPTPPEPREMERENAQDDGDTDPTC